MKIKDVLAEMTDAEVRTWLEEAYAENWAGYSRDEMLEELISMGKAGCVGTEEMSREELEKGVFDQVGEETLEDPEDEAQVAEGMAVWLQENRSGQ
jgi:hypothetical protein